MVLSNGIIVLSNLGALDFFIPRTVAIPISNSSVGNLVTRFAALSAYSAILSSVCCLKSANFIFKSNNLVRVSRGVNFMVGLEILGQHRQTAFLFYLQIIVPIFGLPWKMAAEENLHRLLLKLFLRIGLARFFLFVIETISSIESFQKIHWVLTIISQHSKDMNLVNHLR